jgi:CDK-activating kinase assembly factor MAT1
LTRERFYPTGQDDTIIEILNQSEEKVSKVFDHSREDFATLQDYNLFLEERDGIIFNLANKIDVHEQKRKIKEHKKLRERIGVAKKKKLTADAERLNKQKYIIEEFIRLRKRMSKREILTQDRLQGAVSAEACQTRGFLIEEEDFQSAQKKSGVNLKSNKASQAAPKEFVPSQEAILTMNGEKAVFVMPEPVLPELAKEIVKNISKGAMAELESWNKLTEMEKFKSKRASGWSEMMHFERAKEEAFGSLG